MNQSRRRSCAGKQRHDSLGVAMAHVRYLKKSGMGQGELHAYLCRFCDSFHVGHAPFRIAKFLKKRRRVSAYESIAK